MNAMPALRLVRSQKTATSLLAHVLRPAIRFSLRYSFKIQDLIAVIKVLLLEAAREEIEASGLEPTLSRLSVMTGIPRKFIAGISAEELERSDTGNLITKIIGQWQSSRKYMSTFGRTRALDVEGADSEFAQLVRSVSVDLNPYTVLFELERIGIVLRVNNKVELVKQLHLSNAVSGALEIAADDASDLFCAAEENGTSPDDPRHLHLVTFYDNIPDDAVETIRQWALKEGSLFHKRARKFLAKYDKDIAPKMAERPGRNRVRLGAFSYIEKLKE